MGLFERSRIIAKPGWSRWLVPPAALAIHLSIGQAYAWSVFKSPLAKGLHLDPHWSGVLTALPFQLGIAVLGLSAAFGGKLVDHLGPRFAMFVATVAFSLGFLISALGAETNQYWLIVVGYGLIGGIGLGIGYISPVSTLIKWFPDKPGMATGIAIMGFGGGALIASPWSTSMLKAFGSTSHGIAETFLVHGVVYAIFMSLGVLLIRVPAPGWRPAGWDPAKVAAKKLVTTANVSADNALKTPQFWLLWLVLTMNVTAGIGVLEKASPMIQDYFKHTSTPVAAAAASGFVALLSLANMSGRFLWSWLSDLVGRKNIYRFYLLVGIAGYLLLKTAATQSVVTFVAVTMLLLSFYGGGFSTIPAYLRDLFGTFEVGAIHGRLLTAWSLAGIAGPAIIDGIADAQTAAGKHGPDLYSLSFYIMIGLLAIGFVANELIRPVDAKYHEPDSSAEPGPTGSEAAEPATGESATEDEPADAEVTETADAEAKSESAAAEAKADAKADDKADAKVDAVETESGTEPETVAAEAKPASEEAEPTAETAEATTEPAAAKAADTEAADTKAADTKAADSEAADSEAADGKADEAATPEPAAAEAKAKVEASETDEVKADDTAKADAEPETVAAEAKSTSDEPEAKTDDSEAAASNGKVGVAQAVAVSSEKFAKAEAETVAEQAAAESGTESEPESGTESDAKPKTARSRTSAATKTATRTTRSRTTKAAAKETDATTADAEAPAKPTRSRGTRSKTTEGTDAAPKASTRKTTTRSTTAAKTTAAKTTRKTTAKTASNGAGAAVEAEAGTATETVEDTVN